MILYFIRHGQTDWNVKGKIQGSVDTGLNNNGINQANELSKKLIEQDISITKIYTSRQKRAHKTAQILSQSINVEYYLIDGLEEMNLGEWEGLSWDEVRSNYPVEYSEWYINRRDTRPPKGESYQDMLERVLKAVHRIICENQEDIAIVTHSAVIMTLQCYLTNTPFDMMNRFKTGNADIISIDSKQFV